MTDAFMLQVKIAALAGVVLASPVWITSCGRSCTRSAREGTSLGVRLRPHQRAAVPRGCCARLRSDAQGPGGPARIHPENVGNYLPVDRYLSFFLRMVIVFGIGFLTPLFIVGLNMLGILSGQRLAKAWRYIIFGSSSSRRWRPHRGSITMLLLATPVLVLVGAAVVFSLLNDRRRRRNATEPDYEQWDDDEVSPITEQVDGEA